MISKVSLTTRPLTQAERRRIEEMRDTYHETKRQRGEARHAFARAIQEVFAAKGSVKELTEVARVSKPTIYTLVRLAEVDATES